MIIFKNNSKGGRQKIEIWKISVFKDFFFGKKFEAKKCPRNGPFLPLKFVAWISFFNRCYSLIIILAMKKSTKKISWKIFRPKILLHCIEGRKFWQFFKMESFINVAVLILLFSQSLLLSFYHQQLLIFQFCLRFLLFCPLQILRF